MSTNINFNKKLGLKGGSLITLPTSSTPSFSNVNSFLFDGVDDKMFSTANYTELNGSTNFSISFWIKPLGTNTNGVWEIETQGNNQKLTCVYSGSSQLINIQFRSQSYYYRSAINSVLLNQWSHIVYTYNGALSRYNRPEIYVNGVLSQGVNSGVPYNISDFNSTLTFGDSILYAHGNNYIDEFAVWNSTTLTQTQANELYNGGTPSDLNNIASGLTSPTTWFRMGEEATWNGLTWTMTDVNGGTVLRAANMQESSRTTDVPPNPFANTKSILLDGIDDYVTMGDVLDFERTDAFSISAWVKRGGTGVNDTVVSKMESSGNYRGYLLFIGSANVVKFVLRHQNNSTARLFVDSTSTITDTNWHHISVTYDGSSSVSGVKIYIDGVNDTVTTAGTLNATTLNSSPFNIGARNSNSLFATATIDEVALFNSELSQSNVTSIYNNGVPNDISSLSPISWWRCGDGDTAPTLTDNGSGSNNGTMTNFSTFSTDVPFNYKSIQLDGVDDYVDCGTGLGNSQGTITNFSVSMWIKPSVTSGNDLFFNIGNFSNSFGEIAFQLLSNTLFIKIDNSAYRVWMPYTNTSAWEHLAFVYDGSNSANTKMYINGVLQSPSTGGVHPSSLNLSGLKTIIGAGYSVSYPYSGLQDEVSYFNTTLSQSDITSIYNDGVPNDISSLSPLSWWRCGDGDTAPTLTDNGSASNDGTMTNFTTFSTDVPT